MGSEWRKSAWGDEISLEYGKRLKGYKDGNGKYRVYGSNGPVGWTEKPLAPGPGVILGRKGANRGVEFSKDPFFVIDTAYYVKPRTDLDMRWLYYAILYYELGEINDGSPIPSTTRSAVYVSKLQVPDLPEQCAIAHILGSLDDKIELNRRMNETLEGMAQALFKSWFIDFDPVIDNALAAGNPIPEDLQPRAALRKSLGDARKPLPDDIRNLFPSEFEFTEEMGWIPKGWRIAPLNQIATLETKSVQPNNTPDKLWAHFSIPAFDEGRLPKYELGESIKSGKYVVPPTSVLASKLNPQFPRVWLPDVEDDLASICSTEFMPFVPVAPGERSFLFALLCSDIAQSEIVKRVTGSTGSRQRVKPQEIAGMPIVTPPRKIRDAFSDCSEPAYSRLLANMRNIATLSKMRDSLLPQLLSGEIRIPEAEKLVEAAA